MFFYRFPVGKTSFRFQKLHFLVGKTVFGFQKLLFPVGKRFSAFLGHLPSSVIPRTSGR